MTDSQPGVTVVSLFHDLKLKRSIVNVLWDDGSERRLALQLPICFEVRALSGSLVSSAPE
jgi:hypothetical protein